MVAGPFWWKKLANQMPYVQDQDRVEVDVHVHKLHLRFSSTARVDFRRIGDGLATEVVKRVWVGYCRSGKIPGRTAADKPEGVAHALRV